MSRPGRRGSARRPRPAVVVDRRAGPASPAPNSEHGQLRPPTVTETVAGAPEVAAVVGRAAAQRSTWPGAVGRPGVAPRRRAGRRMPGRAVVDGDLDAADAAAGVGRRAADRDRRPAARPSRPAAGAVIVDVGARRVGRRRSPPRGRAAASRAATPMSANRFTVACCIAAFGGRAAAVVVGVEPPRPLDRAGAEHQRVARRRRSRRGRA